MVKGGGGGPTRLVELIEDDFGGHGGHRDTNDVFVIAAMMGKRCRRPDCRA
jgi:hypothetical protein